MKNFLLVTTAAGLLSACATVSDNHSGAPSGNFNNQGFLYNGNDINFVTQGTTGCPEEGVLGLPGYPVRCGPQQQVIPR